MLKTKFIAKFFKVGPRYEARIEVFPVEVFQADSFTKLQTWVRECIAEDLDCGLEDFDLDVLRRVSHVALHLEKGRDQDKVRCPLAGNR